VVIQPDDIDDLLDNQRIGRQLEGVGQLDARLVTVPTKVLDGLLHYVYSRD
jgi:hypothetical protein